MIAIASISKSTSFGSLATSTQLLVGNAEVKYSLPVIAELRAEGINCEIYPDNTKLKKQFDYATKKGIPYFAIVGEEEISEGAVNVKNLETGEQTKLEIAAIAGFLKEN